MVCNFRLSQGLIFHQFSGRSRYLPAALCHLDCCLEAEGCTWRLQSGTSVHPLLPTTSRSPQHATTRQPVPVQIHGLRSPTDIHKSTSPQAGGTRGSTSGPARWRPSTSPSRACTAQSQSDQSSKSNSLQFWMPLGAHLARRGFFTGWLTAQVNLLFGRSGRVEWDVHGHGRDILPSSTTDDGQNHSNPKQRARSSLDLP